MTIKEKYGIINLAISCELNENVSDIFGKKVCFTKFEQSDGGTIYVEYYEIGKPKNKTSIISVEYKRGNSNLINQIYRAIPRWVKKDVKTNYPEFFSNSI